MIIVIINIIVLHVRKLPKRINLKCPYHKKKFHNNVWWLMFISLTVGIISQIPTYYGVHLKLVSYSMSVIHKIKSFSLKKQEWVQKM